MRFGLPLFLIPWLAALLAVLAPEPAHAARIAPACHAFTGEQATLADLSASGSASLCHSDAPVTSDPIAWLRFDAAAWQEPGMPKSLVAPITKFDTITVFTLDGDGAQRALRMSPGDATALAGGSVFTVPIPQVTEATQSVFVRIDRPWNFAAMVNTVLSTDPDGESWSVSKLIFYAMLFGVFLAPLLFDIAYFWALKQKIAAWHGAMVLAVLGNVMLFSGLIALYSNFPIVILAKFNGLTIALAVGLATVFASKFIEDWAISSSMRRALALSGVCAIVGPGFITLHPPFLDAAAHQLFFIGFLPAAVALVAAMAQALRRGSRSAKFLAVAWLPIIVSGIERIVRGLGLYEAPAFFDELFYFSLAGEVLVSAIGMADRFLSLRRQRDTARSEARILGNLAEHDPLTGLYNRRAIEPRFGELCHAGFTTFALLDLDHFKSVNDQHGHDVGDEVLRAVARALSPDEDTLVMRLGGEEFLLLLRGSGARERAEQRRQSLPRHIAREVPSLDVLVTASMGVVEGPVETMAASEFRDVYSRADKLLYEAKQAGRNRTISEKQTLFGPGRSERRRGDRRKPNLRKSA